MEVAKILDSSFYKWMVDKSSFKIESAYFPQ